MTGPPDRMLELRRAASLCELNRHAEATSRLRTLLASDPHDGDALALLAQAQLGDNDPQGALMSATSAIAVSPDHEWPHRLASIACTRQAMHPEAIAHADQAVRLAPGAPEPYLILAQALVKGKFDLPRARQAAIKALTLAPDASSSHLVLGVVSAAAGDRTDADRAFRRALELDPHSTAAHNELARLQLATRGLANAAGLAAAANGFATAVQINPKVHVARRNLDHVVRTFIAKTTYLIFIDAVVVARLSSHSTHTSARLLPVALLLAAALFALRFLSRLDRGLRTHVWRTLITERRLGSAALLVAIAAVTLIVAALAPQSNRITLVALAATMGALGHILVVIHAHQKAPAPHQDSPPPILGTPVLWLLAFALTSLAVASVAVLATRHITLAGIAIIAATTAGALLTLRTIARRGATTPTHN